VLINNILLLIYNAAVHKYQLHRHISISSEMQPLSKHVLLLHWYSIKKLSRGQLKTQKHFQITLKSEKWKHTAPNADLQETAWDIFIQYTLVLKIKIFAFITSLITKQMYRLEKKQLCLLNNQMLDTEMRGSRTLNMPEKQRCCL